MFVAATVTDPWPSSVGAALTVGLITTGLRRWRGEYETVPLLRSLAVRTKRAAIHMALLTELAWLATPKMPVKGAPQLSHTQ